MNQDKMAKRKAKKIKGFFSNFASWLIICTFLFILNGITYRGHWWAIWPMLGWGLGVAFHAMSVFKYFAFDQIQRHAESRMELPPTNLQQLNENRRKVQLPKDYDESEYV